jgi:cell division protein FtsB
LSSGYYSDDGERTGVSIWHHVNRLLWILLLLTTVAIIIGAFLPELEKQRTERAERARLHRLIDEQRALHVRYEDQIRWLKNDSEYLGIIARDKLDLMKEGETIYRFEAPKTPAQDQSSALGTRVTPLN